MDDTGGHNSNGGDGPRGPGPGPGSGSGGARGSQSVRRPAITLVSRGRAVSAAGRGGRPGLSGDRFERHTRQPGEAGRRGSGRRGRGASATPMRLQLTSMIDVIFQLLIYFVVTASFVRDEGVLTTKLPSGTGPATVSLSPTPQVIEVQLADTGDPRRPSIAIRGSGRPIGGFEPLRLYLVSLQHDPAQGRRGAFPADSPVVIAPMGEVRWQHVVDAFNAAVGAGYTNIRFKESS